MAPHVNHTRRERERPETPLSQLQNIVFIRKNDELPMDQFNISYAEFISRGAGAAFQAVPTLDEAIRAVGIHDVCNLQYTSGTTGTPKVNKFHLAMLKIADNLFFRPQC